MTELNAKQKRFCEEYIIDFNGTQAAIRAGYSKNTTQAQSSRLLSNVIIQGYIAELSKHIAEKAEVTAEQVVRELAVIAFSDVRKLFDAAGNMISIAEIEEATARAIAGIDVTNTIYTKEGTSEKEEYTKKVKLWDKNKALETLAKYFGLFEKDNKQKTEQTTIIIQRPD